MPIHGEYKHLVAHSKIAESLKIKSSSILISQNGDVLELTDKSFKKVDSLKLMDVYVDGTEIGNVDSSLIKDRQRISTDGIIFLTLALKDGTLTKKPGIITKGFIGHSNSKMMALLNKDIYNYTKNLLKKKSATNEIKSDLIKELKNIVYKHFKQNPLIEVQILDF